MKKTAKYFLGIIFVSVLIIISPVNNKVIADCKSGGAKTTKYEKVAKQSQRFVKKDDKVTSNDYFVDASWAKKQIKEHPKKTVVLEAAYNKKSNYAKGHLPNAIQIDTNAVENEKSHWNIFSFKKIKKAFLKEGVTKDTTLIVYSEDNSASSRIAFAAYWAGVKNVKILDGGLQAWKNENLKLSKKKVKAHPAKKFGRKTPAHPEALISTSDDLLKKQKENPKLVIASVRSWDEFLGHISGYSYIKDTGEVNKAVYAKVSKTSSDIAYLTNNDGTLKPTKSVFNAWKKSGITSDKDVTFYCGTGWRACPAFFLAKQSGWKHVSVFDGGWYDWDLSHQKDPKKYPVQLGDPSKDSVKIITGNTSSY